MVLGLSCDYHDAAAALLVDGALVAAAEEERFTRLQHDAGLPRHAVAACLERAGLGAQEVGHVVFYEKPLVLASRWLATRQREGPSGARTFVRSAPDLVRSAFVGARIARLLCDLGAPRPPAVRFVEHHRSHAAAAFLASPFEHAAILTIDGLGEWATASIGHGAHHRLRILEEQRFPHSLGLVYSLVTAWCGFRPNCDEYKVMGLAPYGEPSYLEALEELVSVGADGALRVDARRLRWFSDRALSSSDLRRRLGGPPRVPGAELTDRERDLAASVQALTERAVLAMAQRAVELTGERSLCLAGGVALNCVANGRVARSGLVDDLWVQPAAGDAGSAVGAALSYWHEELGHPRVGDASSADDRMRGSLLGPELSEGEVARELDRLGVRWRAAGERPVRHGAVADALAGGDVVAVFQGPMEFGPRALGNRSLLADPRRADARERLNLEVKGRESFRPFAPAVLAEHVADWFDLPVASPYMGVVAPVRGAEAGDGPLPACTHVDGSARVQTVTEARHPELHGVLTAFHELTGCPVLVNTSFNRAGEPIVATVEQAVRSAAAGGVDLLSIGPALVERGELASWAG